MAHCMTFDIYHQSESEMNNNNRASDSGGKKLVNLLLPTQLNAFIDPVRQHQRILTDEGPDRQQPQQQYGLISCFHRMLSSQKSQATSQTSPFTTSRLPNSTSTTATATTATTTTTTTATCEKSLRDMIIDTKGITFRVANTLSDTAQPLGGVYDSLLLGYITQQYVSNSRLSPCGIVAGDAADNNPRRTPSNHLITVCVTSIITLTDAEAYLSLISGKANSDTKSSHNIATSDRCLNIVGLILGNCPPDRRPDTERIVVGPLRHTSTDDLAKVATPPGDVRPKKCRQNVPHTNSSCSRLQRNLIKALFSDSKYFLCINLSQCEQPQGKDDDGPSGERKTSLILDSIFLPSYDVVSNNDHGDEQYINYPRDSCLGHYSFFVDKMTQCLNANHITVMQYNPDELLRSHLLRGILSQKRNNQQAHVVPGSNVNPYDNDCKIDLKHSNFPAFIPFLFESLESTYCAIKTSLVSNELALKILSSQHDDRGGDGNFSMPNVSCRDEQPQVNETSLSGCRNVIRDVPTALFDLNLVALSRDHHRTLMRKYEEDINIDQRCTNQLGLSSQVRTTFNCSFSHKPRSKCSATDSVYKLQKTAKHCITLGGLFDKLQDLSIRKTCAGQQISLRWLQLKQCYRTLMGPFREIVPSATSKPDDKSYYPSAGSSPEYAISSLNVLVTVSIDIFLGIMVILLLMLYIGPSQSFELTMNHAVCVVDQVQTLLIYLMGMPVGLKLNLPLNQAMGKLFLYHIYLWKTFVTLIRPLLALAVYALMLTGCLGLSCLLSVFCDLLALVTVHIYCFYGYASRFYNLQIRGLIALWRLFRGKKWNLLRHRVDSHSYGTDQLFVGTLSFTILFFLLPTVMTYYLVFLALNTVTRILQETIKYLYYILIVLPLNTILLWLCNSKKVACQISMVPMRHMRQCNNGTVSPGRPVMAYIYLTSCVESLKTTLLINSQLHSYQNSMEYKQRGHDEFRNKLLMFKLLQSPSPLTELLSLKRICNKLLLGEIF